MILQFKAKPEGRKVKRPEWAPRHVVAGGPMNELQLKMAMRRAYRAGKDRLPRVLDLDNLPTFVIAEESGFLVKVTVDYS